MTPSTQRQGGSRVMVNKKSLRIEGVDYAFGVDVYPGGVTIWSDGEGGIYSCKRYQRGNCRVK